MAFPTLSSPHTARPNETRRVMAEVLLALLPGIAALVWYFGWGVVINIALASAVAVAAEAVAVRLGIVAQAGGEARAERGEALAAVLLLHPRALPQPAGETGEALALARDPVAQDRRRQERGGARQGGAVHLGIGAQRPRQAVGGAVEALARTADQLVEARQRPRRGPKFRAAVVLGARPAREGAPAEADFPDIRL